ncbi:hypothetical protein E3Q06_01295 [Wallemia mellicola]|nr:hypothetical protein E3Q21_01394 [Wallemia mellicola]TIB90125.1 hypothetical protein E3Q20_01381 [Wallemia mellicola]TIC36210.1 hypothetical protein E3Q09_01522 [Wallemia mellicola]TIC42011.1 hypothetical protein E3Q07_01294 [Wallemia mellicola]TIC50570.1 hypothetical protein E3Q06_01295 [Wallemia mellicola]
MNRIEEFRNFCLNNKPTKLSDSKSREAPHSEQPAEINREAKYLLSTLNDLNKLIRSIPAQHAQNNASLDVIDEEVTSLLAVTSKRLKELDDKIEATLSTPLNFLQQLIGAASPDIQRQHQHGKLISLNALLIKLSTRYQSLQKQRQAKQRKYIPEYEQIDNIPPPPPSTSAQQLSQEQIQMLERENDELVESNKRDLIEIEKAQHSLLSITSLQSEILTHLTQQSKLVEQLYDDSLNSTGSLGDASKQLLQTRDRQESSRKFLVVFFIMAGLSILFLE